MALSLHLSFGVRLCWCVLHTESSIVAKYQYQFQSSSVCLHRVCSGTMLSIVTCILLVLKTEEKSLQESEWIESEI